MVTKNLGKALDSIEEQGFHIMGVRERGGEE